MFYIYTKRFEALIKNKAQKKCISNKVEGIHFWSVKSGQATEDTLATEDPIISPTIYKFYILLIVRFGSASPAKITKTMRYES